MFYFAFQVKVICAYLLSPTFSSSIRSEGLSLFTTPGKNELRVIFPHEEGQQGCCVQEVCSKVREQWRDVNVFLLCHLWYQKLCSMSYLLGTTAWAPLSSSTLTQSYGCQEDWVWTHRLCSFSSAFSLVTHGGETAWGSSCALQNSWDNWPPLTLYCIQEAEEKSFLWNVCTPYVNTRVQVIHLMSQSYQDTQSSGHCEKINHAPCSNSLTAAKTSLAIAFFSCLPLQELYQITGRHLIS